MSRLKQVIFAYTCEPGSVKSLCYYGSWNIREGGGSDNWMCQSMPTVSPSPFLGPLWQVAFGGTVQSLAFSSPLVDSALCNLMCCFLLFLWAIWEYIVSTRTIWKHRQVVGVSLSSRRGHGQGPAQLQGAGISVTWAAWSPLLIKTGEPYLLSATDAQRIANKCTNTIMALAKTPLQ